MSWAIQVDQLSKHYRMGTAVTPAVDTMYQMIEQRLGALSRRLRGSPPPVAVEPPAHVEANPSHLVLSPHQVEGAPAGHFWALRDVSFEINEGDRVGIVGRNGSGKSTLLKILSRITTPSHGVFRYRGRLVSLLEVGTGFHPDLSGRENILLNAQINGMSTRGIRRVFDEIVDFSELGGQIDTPIKRYSSGMYMRLAFSVAAYLESEILIVDEVLAVGDAGFQKKCLDKMLEISGGQGRTLLFVSHDMNAISTLCDKALELSYGRVIDASKRNDAGVDNGKPTTFSQGLRTVNEAISDYVLDRASSPERVWDEAEAPEMAQRGVTLRRVAVTGTDGVVRDRYDVKEDINITFEFDVNDDLRWTLNAHVYLTTLTGQKLVVSMDNLDVAAKPRPAGRYRETCRVRSPYLNEGIYRVTAIVCTNPTSAHRIVYDDAVTFTLTDDFRSEGVRGDWVREWPAYPMRPRLAWTVEHTVREMPSARLNAAEAQDIVRTN